MGKKLRNGASLFITLLLIFALVLPVGANQDLEIIVNGEEIGDLELIFENGLTVVTLGSLSKILGAEKVVSQDGAVLIDENKIELVADPVVEDEKTYVPLRFIAEKLGYQVDWVPGQIDLTKEELVIQEETEEESNDELTAMDVLVKSNQKAEEVNTYTMAGFMEQYVDAQLDGMEEGFTMDMVSNFSGQVQNDPIELYMKQSVTIPEELAEEMDVDMEVETYMNEEFMYMKMPDQDAWLQMPHFLPVEMLKEQQQITGDPMKAAAQMLEMGMEPSFEEDVTIDGRDYYVIKTALDIKKMMDSQQELMGQIMGAMGSQMNIGADEIGMASAVFEMILEEILAEGNFEFDYIIYIDKETFLPSSMKTYTSIDLELDIPQLLETISQVVGEEIPVEELGEIPARAQLNMIQKGEFTLSDFGGEFVKPDVSNALSPEDLYGEMPAMEEVPAEPDTN